MLRHRGPDASGVWSDAEATLGHARLSIIDLSASANQPMQLPGLPVSITYNGEIFNYRELRTQLTALGYQLQTRSDTEVILFAYLAWGTAAFARLEGMFALALWDGRSRELLLARDRVGIKPLYFCRHDGSFFFASEPKAILAMAPKLERQLDHQAVHEFFWFGNALGERTMFRNINRLAPGCYMAINGARQHVRPFWSITQVHAVKDTYAVAVTEVQQRLRRAVRSHLVSDVPIGVFLSGGVDSSAITALASEEYGDGLLTFSVAFDFQDTSELPYARLIAERTGPATRNC
jgi:asparagine synthase (glutamine-hydrolysing)